MFDYLQQFNSLPQDLRDKVSSKEAVFALTEIENKYGVDLAMVVMKIMIKTLAIKDVPAFFSSELNLSPVQAESLTEELKTKILAPVADYVGISFDKKELDLYQDIDILIKEAGLAIPSEFLVERLKKILATYLKGVRSRIDTKQTLAKEAAIGGLGLAADEVDRVLKVCDLHQFKNDNNETAKVALPENRLDKIISGAETKAAILRPVIPVEYDLKRALESGETKRIVAPVVDKAAPIQVEDKKVEEKSEPTADEILASDAAAARLAQQPPIVKKPENHSLFKKMFADSQKMAAPGAIKFATIATGGSSQLATDKLVAEAPKTNINQQTASIASRPVTPIRPSNIPRSAMPTNSRPKVQDVRPVPKIMGPIEELQFLDLTNFRRLGKTPSEITAKIFNKIKLLERDGYEKMIAGISAWKRSQVSRLYLRLAQESILANQPLKDYVTAKTRQGQESLSWEEIEAIISLNSKLVF